MGPFPLPLRDALEPRGSLRLRVVLAQLLNESGQHRLHVAHDGDVGVVVLAYLGGIDVDVYHARARRESLRVARRTVREARAHGKHEVAFVHRLVCRRKPVHSQHPQVERAVLGKAPLAGERRRDGNLHRLGKLRELGRRARGDDTASRVYDGTLRLLDCARRLLHLLAVALVRGLVRLEPDLGGIAVRNVELAREVARDVDDHGARTSGRSDVICLGDGLGDIGRLLDEVAVFHDGKRDARHIRLLERIAAQRIGGNLTGDDDERDGVHVRRRDARDRVGSTGTARDDDGADLAGRTRIAIGSVHRTLLVAHEDVVELRAIVERVVDVERMATGVSEDGLDTGIFQRPDQALRAGHLRFVVFAHRGVVVSLGIGL